MVGGYLLRTVSQTIVRPRLVAVPTSTNTVLTQATTDAAATATIAVIAYGKTNNIASGADSANGLISCR